MIREAIQRVVDKKSLTADEAAAVMEEIMTGEVTPSQFGAFVTALRLKGETAEEISGFARVMRSKALPVKTSGKVIDVVGTGGDTCDTFNISTCTTFIVAAAGLRVAKHGNRAASSKCGAADVLEALGVKIELTPEQVEKCVEEVGVGFMFAPSFHPAMKYAGPSRSEIGIRTVFNILGPLTNPACARHYLLGVADAALMQKMADVLASLGCDHALVVHGADGMDEISLSAETTVYEVKGRIIDHYNIGPSDLGLGKIKPDKIRGGTAKENAALVRDILSGKKGPQRDIVLANAGAALYAGDMVPSLKGGVKLAANTIDSRAPLEVLDKLVSLTQSFA